MKVTSIENVRQQNRVSVLDCSVENGYYKSKHGSLPDVDIDFDSTRRPEVKAYLEKRYNLNNKQRVFSAGTFTTEKIRSVIKDVCRVHRVLVGTTNYITAIIDDSSSWTDLMRLAAKDQRVYDFIQKHPDVFEEILPLMNQPRSAGIHASALIVTPEVIKGKKVECFDIVPIRKMDDILVSEIDGYSLDDMGLLKNDVLAIAELSRLSDMINICNSEYNANIDIHKIITNFLDDEKVYNALRKGLTQGVFQMSGAGITRFIKQMQPNCINDLIASVALFRPGTLDSGAAQTYCDAKNGLVDPEYLWGTYDILKETYGVIAYQESVSQIAQKIGGLSLSDGVKLVKALSKKKLDKAKVFKDDYFKGAKENGCPKEDAERIWQNVEAATKYCFNKCVAGREFIMNSRQETYYMVRDLYRDKDNTDWTSLSLNKEGKIVPNKIKAIYSQGKRSVFLIKLENGKQIEVTANHKHPTSNGIKMTSELVVGVDKMYCVSDIADDGGMIPELSTVRKVVETGFTDVYDIEMGGENHYFTNGDGIVTCNSHATAYGLTAFVGAWLKVNYPIAFYSVLLKWVDKEKLPTLMNEMREIGNAKIVQPNINVSTDNFETDYKTNTIYWSISRIRQLGIKAVNYIVRERNLRGPFLSLDEFIKRIFRNKLKQHQYFDDEEESSEIERCPVTAMCVRNLIYAGAFDEIENVHSPIERYGLLQKAANILGFEVPEKEVPANLCGKHWFWSQFQITLSGFGSIDYKRLFDSCDKPKYVGDSCKYLELMRLNDELMGETRAAVCATIQSVSEKTYKDKKDGTNKRFGKVTLLQNTDTADVVIWNDAWKSVKSKFIDKKGEIVVAVVNTKYSDYDGKNVLQINKGAFVEIVN